MRVAVAVPYFSETKFGGAELWTRHVALGLRGRGHGVEVVTTDLTRHGSVFEPKAPRRGAPWGLPTRRHRVSLLLGLLARPAGFWPLAPTLPLDPAFRRADVVLVSGVEDPASALAVVGAWLAGKPVLAMPHTHTELLRAARFDRRLLLAAFESYPACYVQLNTRAEEGFWRARVEGRRVLPPVGCGAEDVPPAWLEDRAPARRALGLPADEGVALFLGRLHWGKGVLRAIAAAEGLRGEGRLYLVGFEEPHPAKRSGQKVSLRGHVAERWPQARSRFVGPVEERAKHRWLSACDVLVLPSHHESFGIALLEAWQHGKPVIAWDTGGMPEVVRDGEDGFVVRSVEELRDRMGTLLAKPQLAEQMGARGRAQVRERHRWDLVAERVERNLGEVLAREAARQQERGTDPEIREVEP